MDRGLPVPGGGLAPSLCVLNESLRPLERRAEPQANPGGREPIMSQTIMGQQQTRSANALDKVDPVWARIRREAEAVVRQEPELASFVYSSVLHHDRLEDVVVHRIAQRLDHPDVSGELIRQAYGDALDHTRSIGEAFRADIVATYDRD